MRLIQGIILAIVLAALPHEAFAAAFDRPLTVGMSGEDVRELQKMLNREPRTRVAETGPGSPGNETAFFGERTKDAVRRFQEKYAGEILAPSGLLFGTGFVGELTRRKLHALAGAPEPVFKPAPAPSRAAGSPTAPATAPPGGIPPFSGPFIAAVRPAAATAGETVTIEGMNLDTGDVVAVLGSERIAPQTRSPERLIVTIPKNAVLGPQNMYVETSTGRSRSALVVVTPKGSVPPDIRSSYPQQGPVGAEVTVVGTGFTPKNNEIHTPFGVIKGLASSDGTTLRFAFSPFVRAPRSPDGSRYELPVPFGVVNAHGISKVKGTFTVIIE